MMASQIQPIQVVFDGNHEKCGGDCFATNMGRDPYSGHWKFRRSMIHFWLLVSQYFNGS